MFQRIALFVASLAAVAVLVVGLSAAGRTSGPPAATPVAVVATPQDTALAPRVQVDTVYVAPALKPATVVVHKTVPAIAGGENESEGSGD